MKYDYYAWMHDEIRKMHEDVYPHPVKAIPEFPHIIKVVWEFMYRNKLYYPDAVEHFVTLYSYVGRVEHPQIFDPVEHSVYFAVMLSVCQYADIVTYPFFVAKLFDTPQIEKEAKSKFKFQLPRFNATFTFETFHEVVYTLEGEEFEPIKVMLFRPPAGTNFKFFLSSRGADYLREHLDEFNQKMYKILKKKLDQRIDKIFRTSLTEN